MDDDPEPQRSHPDWLEVSFGCYDIYTIRIIAVIVEIDTSTRRFNAISE